MTFVFPLIVGLAILIIATKRAVARGTATNRAWLGIALMVSSLCLLLATVSLLAEQAKFYFIINVLLVLFFFIGIAFMFSPPANWRRLNQHSLPATIVIWAGLIVGIAHSVALANSAWYVARLIEIHFKLWGMRR